MLNALCSALMFGTCQQIRLSDLYFFFLLRSNEEETLLMRNFFSIHFFSLSHIFIFVISFIAPTKKVIEWIKSEGENSLTKYSALSLECGNTIRDEEQEFEKYYFISMVSVVCFLIESIKIA